MADCTCPKCTLLAKMDEAMATSSDPIDQAHVLGELFAGVTLLAEDKGAVIDAFHNGNTKAWRDIIEDCSDADPSAMPSLVAEYAAVKRAIQEHTAPEVLPHRLN
jgi:hypothetical protein